MPGVERPVAAVGILPRVIGNLCVYDREGSERTRQGPFPHTGLLMPYRDGAPPTSVMSLAFLAVGFL